MSAHAFCGGVSSSAFNGAKRVMSSARLISGVAIRRTAQTAASRYFIVSLPDVADFRRLDVPQDYSDGGVVQWDNGLSGRRRLDPGRAVTLSVACRPPKSRLRRVADL